MIQTSPKPTLRRALENSAVTVTFVKVNGEYRTLECTRLASLIPEEKLPKTNRYEDVDAPTCAVFDLDLQEWRSFRWDSVISYEVLS